MSRVTMFEAFELNKKITLRNRLVMAPMTTWSGLEDGRLSEEEYAYYAERSKGVGMLITATTYFQPSGKGFKGQFYAGEDATLPQLKRLADAIKAGGAKAILQMFHAGRKSNPAMVPEGVTLSASAIAAKREEHIPRELSNSEILGVIESFYEGTKRAYLAGFDGVEIHGANTYLIQQFFSPHSNRREDSWGGDVSKRLSFPLAIVSAVMKAVNEISLENPRPFVVGYRFSPEENSEPGIVMSDTKILIDALCQTPLDYLHVSLSDYRQVSIRDVVKHEENEGVILDKIIQWVDKRKVLIGVGSVFHSSDAQEVLNMGAELVALGRQLLMDPHTVETWERGEQAHRHYDPVNREVLRIPEAMEKVLLMRENWLPLVSK
jgi:2,4-dienoyl-CoA reductase-like NADH-dependent reductase (Old Yellow Enzyme family)